MTTKKDIPAKKKSKVDKRPVGRPVKNKIPVINDTPERVAKTIMMKPSKKSWEYKKNGAPSGSTK